MKKIFILFGIIFVLSSFVSAVDYYVSPTGIALWPTCTNINTPCSLATANTNAMAGDTIFLMDGIYNDYISPLNSGTDYNNMITYQAASGETPVIYQTTYGVLLGNDDYIKVDGLTFTGPFTNEYARLSSGSNYNIIQNNVMQGGAQEWKGIWLESSDYNQILNNVIKSDETFTRQTDYDGPTGDVIQYNTANYNLFEGNTVINGPHGTVYIRQYSSHNVFRSNSFTNPWWSNWGGKQHNWTVIENNTMINTGEHNTMYQWDSQTDTWDFDGPIVDPNGNPNPPATRDFEAETTAAIQLKGSHDGIIRFNKLYSEAGDAGTFSVSPDSDGNSYNHHIYQNTHSSIY